MNYNKQFKRDSPRLAFLVRVYFSVYGVQIECRGRVAHPLIGRYSSGQIYRSPNHNYVNHV
ncbi:hypothetical protein [Vibrio sp. CUB2]|uniref:hypothetical protein n=1 Tax=Vibrio sp. CUB2 TaxID=2315233 RepID=UPI003204666B